MAAYKVCFRASVERDFASIPKSDLEKILRRIRALAKNPRPPGCEKLTVEKDIASVRDDMELYTQFKTIDLLSGLRRLTIAKTYIAEATE